MKANVQTQKFQVMDARGTQEFNGEVECGMKMLFPKYVIRVGYIMFIALCIHPIRDTYRIIYLVVHAITLCI